MLSEEKQIDKIEIVNGGSIQVREVIIINRGGIEIARNYHRYSLVPGQNIDSQPDQVKRICESVWTEEVVQQFQQNAEANKLG